MNIRLLIVSMLFSLLTTQRSFDNLEEVRLKVVQIKNE